MSRSRKAKKGSSEQIAREMRSELRSIIRQFIDLRKPIQDFELDPDRPEAVPRFFVSFDRNRRRKITGLRIGSLTTRLPDERIEDATLSLAKSVWHLKDRLHRWIRATGADADVTAWTKGCRSLLICGDLANRKKHGGNDDNSGLDPRLTLIAFDTSKSGVLEMWYDGATKQHELLVSNPVPIPFRVEMAVKGDQVWADAVEVIHDGFRHWIPLIQKLGILDESDPESEVLRSTLY
jgi:hypothetical protein